MATNKTNVGRNGHSSTGPLDESRPTSRSNSVSPANLSETSEVLDEVELDEAESQIEEARPSVAPVVVPPRATPAEQDPLAEQRLHVLDHLLGMADMYVQRGSLRQAIELYFRILTDHDETSQALEATGRLLAIAQQYENQGELRQARGVYEHLLKVS